MKNLNGLLFIFTFLAFIYACDSGQKKEVKYDPNPGSEVTTNPLDTISKEKFKRWVKSWKQNDSSYIDTSAMTYFNVPIVDFEDMLGEDADSVRVYLGLEHKGLDHYQPHIMFVGMIGGSPNLDLIADYTQICPPYCDTLPAW